MCNILHACVYIYACYFDCDLEIRETLSSRGESATAAARNPFFSAESEKE